MRIVYHFISFHCSSLAGSRSSRGRGGHKRPDLTPCLLRSVFSENSSSITSITYWGLILRVLPYFTVLYCLFFFTFLSILRFGSFLRRRIPVKKREFLSNSCSSVIPLLFWQPKKELRKRKIHPRLAIVTNKIQNNTENKNKTCVCYIMENLLALTASSYAIHIFHCLKCVEGFITWTSHCPKVVDFGNL